MNALTFPFSDPYPFGEQRIAAIVAGGDTPLPDGVYWQSGDASGKPPTTGQGWLSTANLTNLPVGDTATRETAGGKIISILDIRSSFAMTSWNLTARWLGTASSSFYYWNGTIWQFVVSSGPGTFPHMTYADDTIAGSFSSVPSVKQHLAVLEESDDSLGGMSVSDERPS